VLISDDVKSNLKCFSRLFERSLFSAVFLFAALPLPDDLLYVPISISMYNPYKFFTAVFLGKTLIVGVTAIIGRGVSIAFGGNPILSGVTSFVLSILLLVLIVKLDWEKIIVEASDAGRLRVLIELVRSPKRFVK